VGCTHLSDMPELPEVEVCRRALDEFFAGREVVAVEISDIWAAQLGKAGIDFGHRAPMKAGVDGSQGLVGRTVERVGRRGKFYWFELAPPNPSGEGTVSVVEGHLRMTGGWWLKPAGADWPQDERFANGFPDKYCHARILLDDGSEAIYRDVRRFGTLKLHTEEQHSQRLAAWGLDPLHTTWRFKRFLQAVSGSRRELKSLLLDQSRVAGLGNIYVSEICHLAGIDPRRKSDTLGEDEWRRIFDATAPLLRESARVGGTRLTELDDLTYIHEPQLHLDNFEVRLRVYGREGGRCLRRGCTGEIERAVQQNRSTFLCPTCQS